MYPSKILFQISGSIAAYKACLVISRLVQENHEVQAVCSKNSFEFIGPATLEGLTGKPVFSDLYERGQMMDHIYLAKWADLAILCPASANSINQLASGIAQDCIGNLFLAFDLKKPFLIAPAMNQQMLQHPATQTSLEKLKTWGVQLILPETGYQACGETGMGRLADLEKIYTFIIDHIANQQSKL